MITTGDVVGQKNKPSFPENLRKILT